MQKSFTVIGEGLFYLYSYQIERESTEPKSIMNPHFLLKKVIANEQTAKKVIVATNKIVNIVV